MYIRYNAVANFERMGIKIAGDGNSPNLGTLNLTGNVIACNDMTNVII